MTSDALEEKAMYKTKWVISKFKGGVPDEAKRLYSKAAELLREAKASADRNCFIGKAREAIELTKQASKFAHDCEVVDGNLLLNEGIDAIWTLVCGGTEAAFSEASARIGVGDNNAVADATQDDLQATTNKVYAGMDAGFPVFGVDQKVIFQSSFNDGVAEFPWEEFTVDNGDAALKNINRKVEARGTKPAGWVWVVNLEITLS